MLVLRYYSMDYLCPSLFLCITLPSIKHCTYYQVFTGICIYPFYIKTAYIVSVPEMILFMFLCSSNHTGWKCLSKMQI